MGILVWIVIGLVAGILAKALMPGNDPGGIIVTILLGIAGAFVGGWLAVALGLGDGIDGFNLPSVITAVLGAMVLLFVYRMAFAGRGRRA